MQFKISVWASSHFACQNNPDNCYIRQNYHHTKIIQYIINPSKPTSVLSKEKVQSRPSFDKEALNSRKLKKVFMLVLAQLALESNSTKLEIFKLLRFLSVLDRFENQPDSFSSIQRLAGNPHVTGWHIGIAPTNVSIFTSLESFKLSVLLTAQSHILLA